MLRYREEVDELQTILAAAVVPSTQLAQLNERLLIMEQVQRNSTATNTPTAPAELPSYVCWLLWVMLIALAAVCGVLAGHLKAERIAQPTIHHGGIRP